MENEEVIRHQMEETRTSLTEKLETLEEKLSSTVQATTNAVNETVATVRETMHEGVEAVHETVSSVKESMQEGVETVKDWVDVKAHVQERPWLMLSGSILGGFLLGSLLNRSQRSSRTLAASSPPANLTSAGNGWHGTEAKAPAAASTKASSDSMASSWLDKFEPEINKLKSLALGATMGTIREVIRAELPPALGEQVNEVVDNMTRKLGGEPLPVSDWTNCPLTKGSDEAANETQSSGRSQWNDLTKKDLQTSASI